MILKPGHNSHTHILSFIVCPFNKHKMQQSLKKIKMKEVVPASGYIITIIVNILNYEHWPTISIIGGIILTGFMIIYYSLKIYDQYLKFRDRKKTRITNLNNKKA